LADQSSQAKHVERLRALFLLSELSNYGEHETTNINCFVRWLVGGRRVFHPTLSFRSNNGNRPALPLRVYGFNEIEFLSEFAGNDPRVAAGR